MNKTGFPALYDQILDVLLPSQAYLVGGAVRDMLLQRPIYDLDFALPEDSIGVAKKVADQLGGGFFVLDEERETCRVILSDEENQRLVVDFTLFQGKTIVEDLSSRDFTITSMALDLTLDSKLVDPFRGVQDLKDGLIRVTSEKSLEDDPVRCLRAVRLAAQLGFKILPETKDQIRRYHSNLVDVSPERKRDELFRILAGPNQSAALGSLAKLSLYSYLLPGEFSDHRSKVIKHLENLWSLFIKDHDQERAATWSKGLLVHRLGRYRDQICDFMRLELVPGRSFYQLTNLIPLLMESSRQGLDLTAKQIMDQVSLSNQEARFIRNGIQAVGSWESLSQSGNADQPISVYHFFSQYDQAGIAAIFLFLADQIEDQLGENKQDRWIEYLDQARIFLEGYWDRYEEWVDPPPLLDGDEIQQELDIPPGPQIGSLLELLREEQVRSGLHLKEEGLLFLKEQLPLSDESD
jgi:tRNA nucleotidyltransferase/poly(A) polymerase